jgi:hypothetical protein
MNIPKIQTIQFQTAKLYYEKEIETFYINYTFAFNVKNVEPQTSIGIDRGKVLLLKKK